MTDPQLAHLVLVTRRMLAQAIVGGTPAAAVVARHLSGPETRPTSSAVSGDSKDPMVERLLRRKRETDHPDDAREWFERCLGETFEIVRSVILSSGQRALGHASQH